MPTSEPPPSKASFVRTRTKIVRRRIPKDAAGADCTPSEASDVYEHMASVEPVALQPPSYPTQPKISDYA